MNRTAQVSVVGFVAAFFLIACGEDDPVDTGPVEPCTGYPDWQTSDYVLPYQVGSAFSIVQGNCSPTHGEGWNSHQSPGPWMYAYDFLMPVGTPIVAARGGTVVWANDDQPDDSDEGNGVVIDHGDGTYAGYGHLAFGGVSVIIGQQVGQGEQIALSGSSGTTTPHLHFHVSPCTDVDTGSCRSLPLTFRNTRSNPTGLILGETYEALPYVAGLRKSGSD